MLEHDNLVFSRCVPVLTLISARPPKPRILANRPSGVPPPNIIYLLNSPQASKKACRFDIVAITGDGEDGMFRWSRDVF